MSGARRFCPSGPLRGRVRVPSDKSIMQRALVIGALCDGPVEIVTPVWAGDPLTTAGMIADLGVRVDGLNVGTGPAVIHGAGLRGLRAPDRPLNAGNSGTGMRLLAGVLAGQHGRFVLDGDQSLRRRPMGRVVEPLRAMGVRIAAREGQFAPLTITGGSVTPISYRPPVASAQVKSCVLLAGLYCDGETTVAEPLPTRDHTERMLAAAGVPVRCRDATVSLTGVPALHLDRVAVPGDPSSAAFLAAAALVVEGSEIEIADVGLNPTRLGLFEVIRRMGGRVSWEATSSVGGEPRGVLCAAFSRLGAVCVTAQETTAMIDEVTLLGLLASFAEGDTVIHGVRDLRAKESDRLAAIVRILTALGGHAEADEDTLWVQGRRLRGGRIESHGDHRLALLGAVAGLAAPDGVTVDGFAAAGISFPNFAQTLGSVLSS